MAVKQIHNIKMPRRNLTREERSTRNISVTLTEDTIDKIDAYLLSDHNRHANRSALIDDSVTSFLGNIVCENCGQLTPNKKYCCYCGTSLDISKKDRQISRFLYLEQHPEHRDTENKVVIFNLNDNMIRRLIAGDVVESVEDAVVIDRTVYRENIDEYLKERKRR